MDIRKSKSSLKSVKTKDSSTSKRSRGLGSLTSVHGSQFGRSLLKSPAQNAPDLVRTLSTVNSRIIRAIFNPSVKPGCKLPELGQLQATDCIRRLGKSLNIEDYEFNFVSFWVLDILSKLIKDFQLKNFSHVHQNLGLAWLKFVLRCINVTSATREEIFTNLQQMFKIVVVTINEGKPIPFPEDLKIEDDNSLHAKVLHDSKSSLPSKSNRSSASKGRRRSSSQKTLRKRSSKGSSNRSLSKTSSKSSEQPTFIVEEEMKTNLEAFYKIIEMIYLVFADRFTYSMVSLAYSSSSVVTPIEIQIDLKEPKQLKPKPPTPPPPAASPKLKAKGKKKRSAASAAREGSATKSGKKKGKKSRASSVTNTTEQDVADEKEKKPKQKKEAKEEKESNKSKNKKAKKSKGNTIVSTTGDVGDDKGNKVKREVTKSKKGEDNEGEGKEKGKSRTKQEKIEGKQTALDVESKNAKKSKRKQSLEKGKKSRSSSLKGRKKGSAQSNLEGKSKKPSSGGSTGIQFSSRIKLFERTTSPEVVLEKETVLTKDKYVLPLSEAVNKDYVENLLKTLIPQNTEPVEDSSPEKKKKKISGERKKSRKSSIKSGKKGKKK